MMRYQRGFTLLEMVLVLFLLGMMASATVLLTDGLSEQASYDETKRRMALIRTAILGDTSRTINGSPEISGFVADMGRLPLCLAELIQLGDPISGSSTQYKSPCADYLDSAVSDDLKITVWSIDSTTGLGHGWRGPYLEVLPDSDGVSRFRDGYGNTGTNLDGIAGTNSDASTAGEDERNYGWTWRLYDKDKTEDTTAPVEIQYPYSLTVGGSLELQADKAVSLRIQSFGLDGSDVALKGKYPAGDITSDQWFDGSKTLVSKAHWRIDTDSIAVNFINKNASSLVPTSAQTLYLMVFINDSSESVSLISAAENLDPIIASNDETNTFTFANLDYLPTGEFAYVVLCDIPTPTSTKIFLGNSACDDVANLERENIQYFSFIPHLTTPVTDWYIQ